MTMTTMELLTLGSIIFGPIAAVLISLWNDKRRKSREQKVTLLRMLIATRHVPSDPNFSMAVNLIPIEFGDSREVIAAYKEFVEAANNRLTGENDEQLIAKTTTKSIRLVYEIARRLGYSLRETDLQTDPYSSDGWVKRELLLLDSQRAMRDLVNVLVLQSRLMANVQLTAEERQVLGLPDA